MNKYRKRPIEVDAWQWDGDYPGADGKPCPEWVREALIDGRITVTRDSGAFGDTRRLRIDTPEGVMMARMHDWIIRGVKGEIYPCKPDIFEATYEPAEPQ